MKGSEDMPVIGNEATATPDKKWETPKEVFDGTLRERLAQLVEEGSMAPEFARQRLESGLLIDQNLTDPARQAIEFAEIGLEGNRKFREAADAALAETTARVEDALREVRKNLVDLGDDESKADTRLRFEQVIEGLEAALADFRKKIEQIKKLV